MPVLLAVAAGGALGAVTRYALGGWIQTLVGSSFPWGTMIVNVSGSLALGFLVVWMEARWASTAMRGFVLVGVLGGYTTFSTMSWETLSLAQTGHVARAAVYALGSLALGVAAAVVGMLLARQLG